MDGLTKSILLWRDWRSVSVSVKQYRTMTVRFYETDRSGYGAYLDDAVNMPYGKTEEAISAWQEFFGFKPCLFKNGEVVGYLNPNDYTKFEDGTSADITSGNAGDVMVEFPRRGIKISKSGNTVTLSMTDDPNASGFTYYAHTRGSKKKDYFYVGAYDGYVENGYSSSGRLRSLSGKTPSDNFALDDLRRYARYNGYGYCEFTFYQHTFIQCMYLLQFKGNLDSQSMVGYGYVGSAYTTTKTGGTNKKGTTYGITSSSYPNMYQMKIFGIEDYWGNTLCLLDGVITGNNGYYLTTTDDYSNTNGYIECIYRGGVSTNIPILDGYITDTACTSEAGFLPIAAANNQDHYYYDYTYTLNSNMIVPAIGGNSSIEQYKGIFTISFNYSSTKYNRDFTGGRLSYL